MPVFSPMLIRPMAAGEIPSPRLRSPEAISACGHCDSASDGTEVAIAMTASRVPGPCTPGASRGITGRTVGHHASLTHPDPQEITIRWRGSFGYLDAWAGEGDGTAAIIHLADYQK